MLHRKYISIQEYKNSTQKDQYEYLYKKYDELKGDNFDVYKKGIFIYGNYFINCKTFHFIRYKDFIKKITFKRCHSSGRKKNNVTSIICICNIYFCLLRRLFITSIKMYFSWLSISIYLDKYKNKYNHLYKCKYSKNISSIFTYKFYVYGKVEL